MRRWTALTLAFAVLAGAGSTHGYPVDGSPHTGITRLEAYSLAKAFLLETGTLPPGAFLSMNDVQLSLRQRPDFRLPDSDPELVSEIRALLGADVAAYGIAVLDLSDPNALRYAELNGSQAMNVGSVGKILVALAWFQTLADLYPDVTDRERLLKNTQLVANDFIRKDSHVVPVWKPGDPKVVRRPIAEGDRVNLWTWFDWMMSASSNAAASMLMSELLLLRHFGSEYPVSPQRAAAFFRETPQAELSKQLEQAMFEPVRRNGLNSGQFRQGSFFTREGKARVPGGKSWATPRQLLQYMLLIEQGRLVDAWSSLEIKRLLYLTDGRIRYASSPALHDSAVYYKSGSLYSCKEESGYECGKYMGNRWNYLSSVATVETPNDATPLRYIVVVMSNVLKKNSAEVHQSLGTRLHRLMEAANSPTTSPADAPSH